MIRRLTFCINHFLVWSTCMLSFFHWKDQQRKQNNDAVLWSSPRNPKLMFVNICQCLFTFYLCNFMLNNAHLLLLACAFVSRFDYYSVYGSFNKDVLINLPKSWFISCFHFLLPMSGVCRVSPVVILDCWYRAHWYWAAPYTARNDRKRNEFSLVKNVCAI